jgi:hypothetical protein
MTNDDVQRLADELITLDPVLDSARVLTIRNEISAYIFGFAKLKEYLIFDKKSQTQITEDFYYIPLAGKCVTADVFFKTLNGLLDWNSKRNEWGYKPNKSVSNGKDGKVPFLGALYFLFSKRGILESELKQLSGSGISNSLEERQEKFGNSGESADDYDGYKAAEDYDGEVLESGGSYEMESLSPPPTEFEIFLSIAPLVALRKTQEKHLPKSKRGFLEGFFTFDTAKQTKDGLFDGGEVIASNDTLFPIMEIVILEYLLDGAFESMRDVVRGAARDTKRLERRNEAMQVCYGLSKPTVVTKNKLYRQLFDAVHV